MIAHLDRRAGAHERTACSTPRPLVTHHMRLGRRARRLRDLRPPRGTEDRLGALMDLPQLDGVTHRTVAGARAALPRRRGGSRRPDRARARLAAALVDVAPRGAPARAARPHLVMIDLRGFGWSDAPPGRYDKQTLADDLLARARRARARPGGPDRPRLGRLERLPGLPGRARALRGLPLALGSARAPAAGRAPANCARSGASPTRRRSRRRSSGAGSCPIRASWSA